MKTTKISEISGGAICGGVISLSMNIKNMKKYGIWADTMAYILPDDKYKRYVSLLKAGKRKEASLIFDRFAHSQI